MRRVSNYIDAEARALAAPVPERTETYVPIPHNIFINTLKERINNAGYRIAQSKYITSENGNKLIGLYVLENDYAPSRASNPDFGMMVGFRNSYDKSMTVALAAGANVFVCGNGVVTGSMVSFHRKHTGNIEGLLEEKINELFENLLENFVQLTVEIEVFKQTIISRKQKAELLGRLYFEENILSPTQMSIVKRELKHSEHFHDDTLWSLYNNVTEALKTAHPVHYFEKHFKLHEFMTRYAGILAVDEIAIPEMNETAHESAEVNAEAVEFESVERVAEEPTATLTEQFGEVGDGGNAQGEFDETEARRLDEELEEVDEEEEEYDENRGEGRDEF